MKTAAGYFVRRKRDAKLATRENRPLVRGRQGALILLALSAAILSGCGASRPIKYYQLTVPADVKSSAAPTASASVALALGPLVTSHLYREDRIVYSAGPGEMGTYAYQRWAEPPVEMMQEVLLRELRASGRYQDVHSQRSNAQGDFVLRGHLYDFKEVSGSPLIARVTAEWELRDLRSGSTVWTHYYSHDEPVNGKDVAAMVAALDRNVQRGIAEVTASLDQYFTAQSNK
ncbi:MAG TPA: ABC-type transport auxiliary lipoprotein family protein [Candidatus Dormibacteraeota bacterium]|nr:ABC-type transport auxiliary lipoprotein family protein [Candidatus Dormibacteraeota bacterium]